MGIKRPLEEEHFPEPAFKHQQLDYNQKLILNTEEFPSYTTAPGVDSPGEAKSDFSNLQFDYIADKELESSVPLSVITSSSSEEDTGNGDTSFWSYFPGFSDFDTPRRPLKHFEDPYIHLLWGPPRKEVPIGPDHQAEVPHWDPNALKKDEREQMWVPGPNCIIPMPDFHDSTIDGVRVGSGRTDCTCMDVGSMRCVQQHVKESREKLRDSIGDDNFKKLGFHNMGDDEVAHKWTPHDEKVFHEVVFLNPVSLGRNFWKLLGEKFPTRTSKELVSYYFNVFMLRRRAVQNRSYSLEIDSDDDEDGEFYQKGSQSSDFDANDSDDLKLRGLHNGNFYLVGGEENNDDDSTVEDLELDSSWVDDFWSDEPKKGSDGIHGDEISGQEIKKVDDDLGFDF